jgi:hypothetical protein
MTLPTSVKVVFFKKDNNSDTGLETSGSWWNGRVMLPGRSFTLDREGGAALESLLSLACRHKNYSSAMTSSESSLVSSGVMGKCFTR